MSNFARMMGGFDQRMLRRGVEKEISIQMGEDLFGLNQDRRYVYRVVNGIHFNARMAGDTVKVFAQMRFA
jgi:hypothetical protein